MFSSRTLCDFRLFSGQSTQRSISDTGEYPLNLSLRVPYCNYGMLHPKCDSIYQGRGKWFNRLHGKRKGLNNSDLGFEIVKAYQAQSPNTLNYTGFPEPGERKALSPKPQLPMGIRIVGRAPCDAWSCSGIRIALRVAP